MASSNEERPARHAGSIVDPSVREDGIGEPHVQLTPPPPADEASQDGESADEQDSAESIIEEAGGEARDSASDATAPRGNTGQRRQPGHTLLRSRTPRGQAMRERLLEKARSASASTAEPAARDDESDGPAGFTSLRGVDHALDQVASRTSPGDTRPVRVAGTELSPNALAIFGTLFGLATVASLFAVLVHLAPRDGTSPPPSTEDTSESAEAAAVPVTDPSAVVQREPLSKPSPPAGPWRIESGEKKPGTRVLKGKIGSAPFLRAIQDAGLTKNQAYRVYSALKDERDFNRCRPSDEFLALVERASSRVLAFEYVVSSEEVYQAREDESGTLIGKQLDMKVVKRRVQVALQITDTFVGAARAVGLDPSIARVLDRAFEGHTTTSELGRGDMLRVIAVEVSVLDQFSRYDGIEAIELLPAGDGKPTRIYYFPGPSAHYVDARGRAPGLGEWARPVKNAPVTSKFNPKRFHPILKRIKPHTGTDFGAPTGTPVLAVKEGTVTFVGAAGPNGNYVALRHRNGYESGYSHLSRFESALKSGDAVRKGQVIGYVGSTGRSTGPHLHFSVKKDGKFIDPESLGLGGLSVLPRAEREQLEEVRAKYDPLLEGIALPEALPTAAPTTPAPSAPSEEEDLETTEVAAAAAAFAPSKATDEPKSPPAEPASPAAAPVAATAASPAAVASPATAPSRAAHSASLYLSDKELMKSQPSDDDGEVDE